MSRAEELAKKLETGDRSGMWYPGLSAAAELRRLSAVEAELAECKAAYESQFKELHALKKAIGDAEPVAQLDTKSGGVSGINRTTSDGTSFTVFKTGNEWVPLYTLKGIK